MKKIIVGIVLTFCVMCCICVGVGFTFEYQKVDMVYVNEVIQCLKEGHAPQEIVYDYVLTDKSGVVIASSKEVEDMEYQTRLNRAYAVGDIVVDFDENSKVIFHINAEENYYKTRINMIWLIVGACLLLAAVMCAVCFVLYRRTVYPFNRLKTFAGEVAKGNLDSPLLLDKYLTFGAFSEAFDIMRNNLKESRVAEQNANLERSRLLQEIGHEIKTPLSTIKAVSECGYAMSSNKNYTIILEKATAIDSLINDFYQKALEEEGQLNIYITKHTAQDFKMIIANCDYNQRVVFGDIPDCEVLFDRNRMTQIVDNVIANSYKYADTEINVSMMLNAKKLQIEFKDFGEGVDAEQLSYIMDRFYRGEKTSEKLGQGLGLNICKKLIGRMGGEMECYNDNGFVVKLILPLYEFNL